MILIIIVILGLCLGSFINAFLWRLHTKRDWVKGRSECVHCHHKLAVSDLIPIISWLALRGKCRYCRKPISWQYPLVELGTAGLFLISYLNWPLTWDTRGLLLFVAWIIVLTGLMVLAVYDLKWMLLPDRIIFPLIGFVTVTLLSDAVLFNSGLDRLSDAMLGLVFCGGIFYLLFQLSKGKWIGGGDVKLGFLLGLIVGGPVDALLVIFIASLLGTAASAGFLLTGKLKATSRIPFGPFLIAGAFVMQLWGSELISWYTDQFLTL